MSSAEQQFWISILLSALTGGLALIAVLFWRLWATLATKTELERLKNDIVEADGKSDLVWAEMLRGEISAVRNNTRSMHEENRRVQKVRDNKIDQIVRDVALLVNSDRTRHNS